MIYTTDGLVIRAQNSGDNDRLITVLTPDGQVNAVVKGARSMKSKLVGIAQPYVYGNFEINRRENYSWVRSGSSYEMFYRLRDDVQKLFLASYICDVAYELTGEDTDCSQMLKLTLNTLFAVMTDMRPLSQIKAVFELRAAAVSGYMPDVSVCEECGRSDMSTPYFDVMNGALICSECLDKRASSAVGRARSAYDDLRESSVLSPLTPASLAAVRYVLGAGAERIFSFNMSSASDLEAFAGACESYLLNHLGRGFDSLDLYYSIL